MQPLSFACASAEDAVAWYRAVGCASTALQVLERGKQVQQWSAYIRALIDEADARQRAAPPDQQPREHLAADGPGLRPACHRCGAAYDAGAALPLLLDCGHTMCAACVGRQARKGAVQCWECGRHTRPGARDAPADSLPTNYALLGLADAAEDAACPCPVCYEPLGGALPLALPCGHTLCEQCALSVAQAGREGHLLTCPVCREGAAMGPGALRVNYCLQSTLHELDARGGPRGHPRRSIAGRQLPGSGLKLDGSADLTPPELSPAPPEICPLPRLPSPSVISLAQTPRGFQGTA